MSTDTSYTPPVTEELAAEAVVETPAVTAPPKASVEIKEPTLVPAPDVIGVSKILNAKGTVVTEIMVSRIDRHMKYLKGEEGFKDENERDEEQKSFIETIGNSMKLDQGGYAIITDYLIAQIRANPTVFKDGMAFRFTAGLKKSVYRDVVVSYEGYIELLSKIASNWTVRYKLKKLIDISYAIHPFPRKAQANITQYFNQLAAV